MKTKMTKKKEGRAIGVVGTNQHRDRPIYKDLPNLAMILQGYIDADVLQMDIPERILEEHGTKMALRTVQKYMKELGIVTARRSGLTSEQKERAVELISMDDPAGRWGGRLVQQKLARQSIHSHYLLR
ncbi:hypothetical protein BDQ17DRAFT_369027 [Cyathus striatus]|nr:hypothetical protein BDQ17DRAFT_369027 [Cyathus striatus]